VTRPSPIGSAGPATEARRAFLLALAALPLAARAGAAAPRLLAAWDAEGSHHVGLLAQGARGWRIHAQLELPTRAHGLAVQAGGHLLVVARRPGDWLLRWHPRSGRTQWHWIADDRRFNGHTLVLGDRLYTTETALDSGAGLLVERDARTLERRGEWPAGGIDTHALLSDGRGGIWLANGGIPTQPETGRAKLDLAHMDSSLARLDARTGRITAQWRLADPRLSLRHLAWRGRTLAVALQAQHDDAAQRESAPVLAVLDDAFDAGSRLRTLTAPQALDGYGGDVAAGPQGFAVSCPRVNGVARWDAEGRWLGLAPHPEACALAATPQGQWAAGPAGWLALGSATGTPLAWPQPMAPDNHAVLLGL
jgi:hypothetical protein